MPKRFITNCINADGDDIQDMNRSAHRITRRTFLRHVNREQLREVEQSIGYDRNFPMSRDWAVGYYTGTYQGKPCAFFQWSRIEHIFV